MTGADEYCNVFKEAEQVGCLYILPGSHARGRTFRVFVLPDGEVAIENGANNPPLNPGAVEVYGAVGGNPGWTEHYGWIHKGPWQDDLRSLVIETEEAARIEAARIAALATAKMQEEEDRVTRLLSDYVSPYAEGGTE